MSLVVALAAILLIAVPASAHDSTDRSIVVTVNGERLIVAASVAFADLGYSDSTGDGLLDVDELAEQESEVAKTIVESVRDHVDLSLDGMPVDIVGAGVASLSATGSEDSATGASEYVSLVFASAPHDGTVADVQMNWGFDSPSGVVVLTHADGAIAGELSPDGTITFTLDAWSSVGSFFDLGIEHIQFGLDHLLFLLVLTLAVAGVTVNSDTTWRTVKLVTAFTLGHAVSLALAYFDLISVPTYVVEPAISLSIVGAAALAIRGRATEARPWVVALVGLVHGLGFASSLDSLGVATSQRVAALAAFNVGIDVAQTAVVLIVLGGLWLGGRVLAARIVWLRTAVAAGAAVLGFAWTASRVTDLIA